ncbi:transposase [Pelagicoccus enzymogenes]|uniref:REP-associated tyrosine transposase n=1 Tax=Pelagicoccus enzymogenes TaxID=2773457 RepID=UPI00280CBED7|nr:transposase [Pelagicoccus enzymogenes]MDQ8201112.1 transposase [Pelagicoccus enzymogenes]
MPLPRRKTLNHVPPSWVKGGELYFITICHRDRDSPQLLVGELPRQLIETVQFYHRRHTWHCRLFLLMPDHLHALIAFPSRDSMTKTIANWKRYTARTLSIDWQTNFFDHRIRNDENWELKAQYIRENPVRAGLVKHSQDWPHFIAPDR